MDNETKEKAAELAGKAKKKATGIWSKIVGLWKSGVKGKVICIVGVLMILGIIGALTDDGEGGGTSGSVKTKTITLPGGMKMEMVWCPPGTFMMGSPAPDALYGRGGEKDRDDDEEQHQVTLTKGFWMAKTEVTQEQFISVMGNNPSEQKGEKLPVENVSWEVCREFCQKTGLELPTEAEWEYACRAGSTGPYAGNGRLNDMGWYDGNSEGKTHPVGQKRPNAWGLYDMHGNVMEWCADLYDARLGDTRVLRGGCYRSYANLCRSANRIDKHNCYWNDRWGFRPVAHQE